MMEYDTFVNTLQEISQGQEIELFVRDLTPGPRKYGAKHVKAVVSSSGEQLPDAESLWLRFMTGVKHPEPWRIKIIAEI
jgi:hypothetical protein